MSNGGKGDKRRPTKISKEEEDLRWKLAFAKTEKEKQLLKTALKKLIDTGE
jgi:hypothetical protein